MDFFSFLFFFFAAVHGVYYNRGVRGAAGFRLADQSALLPGSLLSGLGMRRLVLCCGFGIVLGCVDVLFVNLPDLYYSCASPNYLSYFYFNAG